MKSAPLLTSLALCSLLALPAVAPSPVSAQAQPAVANGVRLRVFSVGDQAEFDKLFGPNGDLAKLSAQTPVGQTAEATVRLTSKRFKLPYEINVPRVHVTVTSAAAVKLLGVNYEGQTRPSTEGATLYLPESPKHSTVLKSPITFKSVHIENPHDINPTFYPSANLTIDNVRAVGKVDNASATPMVRIDDDHASPHIVIKNSRFENLAALRIYRERGTSVIEGNEFVSQMIGSTLIDYDMSTDWVPTPTHRRTHVVYNNLFHLNRSDTAVKAGRPGVRIEHNEFRNVNTRGVAVTGVVVGDFHRPEYNRPKIINVEVLKNRMTKHPKAGTSAGIRLLFPVTIGRHGAVIEGNDLSQTNNAIDRNPEVPSGDAVRFCNNYVGKAAIDLIPAPTCTQLTASPKDAGLVGRVYPDVPPPVVPPKPKPQPQPQPVPPPVTPPAPPVVPPVVTPTAQPTVSPPGGTPSPGGSDTQSPAPQVPRTAGRVAGESRFETATQVSSALYPEGTNTVVIARHDVVSDSVSAVPLAEELKAPVLLTPSQELHPATRAELTRLLPKGGRVIIMGGQAAVSAKAEQQIASLGMKTERIAGPNRAATAVETAKRLQAMGKATQVLLADGSNWQPGLISGPVAAEVDGVTLLSNGGQIAPETAAFLTANPGAATTAIGDVAAGLGVAKTSVTGADPTVLSLAVADKFFAQPKAVGVATTADFADALAGGLHIAMHNGPLLLVPSQGHGGVTSYLAKQPAVAKVWVYGGKARFDDKVIEALAK